MNKRFFIFVLLMSVALFFINQHFTTKKQQEYDNYQKQVEIKAQSNSESIQDRVAPLSEIPLVKGIVNQEQQSVFTWLIACDDNTFFTTSWDEKWAETLYINNKPASLIQTDDHFAIYSFQKQSKISSVSLPLIGIHDLQIISFPPSKAPTVSLGEFDEGELFFPSYSPEINSIVLYKTNDGYQVVGVYDANRKTFTPLSKLSKFQPFISYELPPRSEQMLDQQEYFVLENETMQVVFSNVGGAIAEINLPFRSLSDPQSVVLPIEFDRIIDEDYPSNAQFPSFPYRYVETEQSIIKKPVTGGYYPLLRRGIQKGPSTAPVPLDPKYYSFNTLSSNPETATTLYKIIKFNKTEIQFEAQFPNRRIIKTYSLPKEKSAAPYCLDVSIKVEGDSRGLWINSGVPEVELISGSPAPSIKYTTVRNHKHVVEKLSLPKTATTMSSFQPNWISNSNGYFTLIIDPLTDVGLGFQADYIPGVVDPSKITLIDAANHLYPSDKYPGYAIQVPLKRSSKPMQFRLYAGPIDEKILKKVDNTYTDSITGYTPNYIQVRSFHGWFSFISEPFAKFLYLIMSLFFSATGSWGISIILLTVVLRLIMYPLNAWSIKSTLKMQELAPKLEKMKSKQKKAKDPKQSQIEMMAFYKEHKINPMGGCLPLIIQMPFLFGMFDLLKSAFPLRGASFIPGWINNLTAPDVVFSWSYHIPFIGTSLHALPLLLGGVMYCQQKITQSQNKGKDLSEQQQQQQQMGMIMSLIFPLLFYNFPSGLNLYWLSSMSLQILQQWYMSKRTSTIKNDKEITIKPKKK